MFAKKWVVLCTALVFSVIATAVSGFAVERKVIHFLTEETDPPSIAAYKAAIKEFEELHPSVKVLLEPTPTEGLRPKLASAVAAGLPLDIFTCPMEFLPDLARARGILPLEDVVKEIGEEDFVPGSRTIIDGHDWWIPYCGGGPVLWLRTDLFKNKGLAEYPDNWNEWLECAEVLTGVSNGKKIYGIALPGGENLMTNQMALVFNWQNGQTAFDKDFKCIYDSPRSAEALAFYKGLAQYAPPDIGAYSYFEVIDAYTSGRVAMAIYWGRILGRIKANAPQLDPYTKAIPLPKGRMKATLTEFNGYSIGASTKYPEVAKEFVKYLSIGEEALDFLFTVPGHLIPPLHSLSVRFIEKAKKDPFLSRHLDDLEVCFEQSSYGIYILQEAGAIDMENLKIIPYRPICPYMPAALERNVFANAVGEVLFLGVSPEDAAKNASAKLNEIIKETTE